MKSYSQNREQEFILAACPGSHGRFLDIGAWSAIDKSNTRALYENDWGGVLVEPSPGPFANLCEAYGKVPRIMLINAAVVLGPAQTEVDMWLSDDALSTTERANYQKWAAHATFTGKSKVPAITLGAIFAEHGDFDFVSIDTEGTSVDLLRRMLEIGQLPKCICVEYDDRISEAMAAAGPLGYAITYKSAENLVLVR